MQVGYNMNIRCNQKFMFCKDRGIDFSVWLCRGYAWYARPALLGIPTLPPAGWNNFAFQRFNRRQKLNFRCRRYKNKFLILFFTRLKLKLK